MEFQWDDANVEHIANHHVTPEEAVEVFYNKPLELEGQLRNNECRYVIIGPTSAGRVLAVVWTQREDYIRVVTAFDASRKMRKRYEKEVLNE